MSGTAEESDFNEKPGENTVEGHAKVVATHYNTIPEMGVPYRNQSKILYMRNFNNWIKSMLISEFIDKIASKSYGSRIRALDMGCGKGGDLFKWRSGNITHLICADIAENSVDDCRKRYEGLKAKSRSLFSAEFHVADLTKERLRGRYQDPSIQLDIVSCQFAFHYCFESLPQADCMLRNASECLKKGGYFLATIPDAYEIVRRLKASEDYSFGNEIYRITFDEDCAKKLPLFGARYNFQLEGVVDCPEFLVHFPTLVKLAEKYKLKLVLQQTFHKYYEENFKKGEFLMRRMSALECYPDKNEGTASEKNTQDYSIAEKYIRENNCHSVGTMSLQQWEATTIYMVFAFQKE